MVLSRILVVLMGVVKGACLEISFRLQKFSLVNSGSPKQPRCPYDACMASSNGPTKKVTLCGLS